MTPKTLSAQVHAKMAERGISYRTDFSLADVRPVEGGRSVRVLAEYGKAYGVPTPAEAREWVRHSMGEYAEQVSARVDTLTVYPEGSFFTMFLERKSQRLPLSAAAKMVPLSPGNFGDEIEGTHWEVVRSATGGDYLLRKESMSTSDMLEARRGRITTPSTYGRKKVCFADVQELPYAPGGFATCGIGDKVYVMINNVITLCTVSSINSNGVKVKPEGSGSAELIDPMQVLSVVEKSTQSLAESDNMKRDFFSRVYTADPHMVELITPNATKKVDPPAVMKETVSAGFTVRATHPVVRAKSVSRVITTK
jgi:hypothetical protein